MKAPLSPRAQDLFEADTERRHEIARTTADRYPESMWALVYRQTLITLEAVDRQFSIQQAWREELPDATAVTPAAVAVVPSCPAEVEDSRAPISDRRAA